MILQQRIAIRAAWILRTIEIVGHAGYNDYTLLDVAAESVRGQAPPRKPETKSEA
jgi:hypothetical protein